MRKGLLFLTIILVISSCSFKKQPEPYKGYTLYNGSVYYRYAGLSVRRERIAPGETMEVFINYSRMNDSVFWDSRGLWYPFTILLSYDSLEKSSTYRKLLLKSNEGDSINFIVKKEKVFGSYYTPRYLANDSMIKVNIRIASILDSNQLKDKMKKYTLLGKDKELKEQIELTRYIMLNNVPDSDKKGNIYLIPLIYGSGPEVTSGSRVSISYRGYFLNHRTFDSIPVNEPLDFVIGDSGQVIAGMETGIKKMREGEFAKIIIPSHSAFGEKGSSTGIVPPYATVVYEVTMLKVKQTLKK
jgi:FKBP-type peptidyl-prolyl cis-trans isomerase FkpA